MRFIALIVMIYMALAQPVEAQDSGVMQGRREGGYNYFDFPRPAKADPEYVEMTRKLIRGGNLGFDFQRYRLRYVQSIWYDPIGEKVIIKLEEISKRALGGEESAFQEFRELVATHMANIDVVLKAREKAEIDNRFGGAAFYEKVARGLLQNVLVSGTGETLEEAYDVITMGEETMLLAQLGLRPLSTEYRHRGIREFNRHIAEEIDTGRKTELFVSVRFPMSKLRHDKKKQEQNRNRLAR